MKKQKEVKELFVTVKSKNWKNVKKAVTDFADGKNDIRLWNNGRCYVLTPWLEVADEYQEDRPHFDAVEIWPAMTAEEMKNAHAQAAARYTIRRKEERAEVLLARGDSKTPAERLELLALVNIAYHDGGKIEGCSSIDGCASCDFCRRMMAAAEGNILMICRYCYAARDAWKAIAWRTHSLNARILSSELFTREELAGLALTERCRFNEDGDTVNEIHARNLLRIVATHDTTDFGYWYKNAPAVEKGLHAEGIHDRASLPRNCRFIHSSALIGFQVRATWFDDFTFTVYPDQETTDAAIAAGAWPCNGRRCRACGFHCYTAERADRAVDIAELLRCKPAERAATLEAYWLRRMQEDAAPMA